MTIAIFDPQRPDWEPTKPGGAIVVNGRSIHGLTCEEAETIVTAVNGYGQLEARIKRLEKALRGYRRAFIETVGDPSITPEMERADKAAADALAQAGGGPKETL